MSKTTHTPGPWEIDWNNTHGGTIATVHGCTKGWADIWSMQWLESGMGEEVMDANANLIATAPELYQMLVWFAYPGPSEDRPSDDELRAMSRAALAKARGEQP